MTILQDLHAASFKGATFLIKSGTTTGGRKTVTHEYPNSDRRFVEDLGELKQTFTIEGLVHGDNYFNDRDALIAALKSQGSGELVHPFFGTVKVVAQPYTLSENTTRLGVANFSMTFSSSEDSVFPVKTSDNKSLINDIKNEILSSVQADIGNIFSVSRKSAINFVDATAVITSMADAFEINSDTIFKVQTEISDFTAKLETFSDNTNTNAFDAVNLALELNDVFDAFELLGTNARNQFDILQGLFDFGTVQEQIITSTTQRVERESNRDILNSAMRANALAQAYNTVTDIAFSTESDIKETQNVLDAQFDFIVSDNNLSGETINSLKDLRVEVRDFLEQESATAFKIAMVSTAQIPTTILTYLYYGNTNNTQAIIDLNKTLDPTFIQGNVDILTK